MTPNGPGIRPWPSVGAWPPSWWHVTTRWALDHVLGGVPLEELAAADFAWKPGWEYRLPA